MKRLGDSMRVAVRTATRRMRGRGISQEVWTLAILFAAGGAAVLLAAAFPISRYTPVRLGASLGVVAFLYAAALLAAGHRVRRPLVHASVAVMTLLVGILVSRCHTNGGFMFTAFVYQWIAVYVAFFFSVRAIRLHALWITVTFGAATLIAGVRGTEAEWAIVSLTAWAAAITLGGLSERLRTQADTDHLTGLLNRNGLEKAATRELAMAARTGNPLTIGLIDLDDFKEVNDRDGHHAGDVLLADLARAWQETVRPGDLLVRFGGDEFLLLLPATSESDAEHVVRRLRAAHPAGWSIGLVTWRRGETLADGVGRADARLYEAKARRPQAPLAAAG